MQDVLQIIEEAGARAGIPPMANDQYKLEQSISSINLILQEWFNKGHFLNQLVEADPLPLLSGVKEYELDIGVHDIHSASLRNSTIGDNRDIAMTKISIKTYSKIPNKNVPGRPLQFVYDRQNQGRVIFWQVPDRDGYEFYYWYRRAYEEITEINQTPDISYQQNEALAASLAVRLCEKFNFDPTRLAYLKELETMQVNVAIREDDDGATLNIRPDAYARRGIL